MRSDEHGTFAPNAVRASDLAALIGWLAVVEGELVHQEGAVPPLAVRLQRRFEQEGLLEPGGDEKALRQAVNDLNHRLRYSLGEYPAPPAPVPVPALEESGPR